MAADQRLQFISWEPSVTEKDTYLATFKIGMGRDSIYEVIFYKSYHSQFYTIYSKPNSAEACAAWLISGPGSQAFAAYYGIERD